LTLEHIVIHRSTSSLKQKDDAMRKYIFGDFGGRGSGGVGLGHRGVVFAMFGDNEGVEVPQQRINGALRRSLDIESLWRKSAHHYNKYQP